MCPKPFKVQSGKQWKQFRSLLVVYYRKLQKRNRKKKMHYEKNDSPVDLFSLMCFLLFVLGTKRHAVWCKAPEKIWMRVLQMLWICLKTPAREYWVITMGALTHRACKHLHLKEISNNYPHRLQWYLITILSFLSVKVKILAQRVGR